MSSGEVECHSQLSLNFSPAITIPPSLIPPQQESDSLSQRPPSPGQIEEITQDSEHNLKDQRAYQIREENRSCQDAQVQQEREETANPQAEEDQTSAKIENGQESEQTIEARLIDKIAEFEGKVEALQTLKQNLYQAIEQLEKEKVSQHPEASSSTSPSKVSLQHPQKEQEESQVVEDENQQFELEIENTIQTMQDQAAEQQVLENLEDTIKDSELEDDLLKLNQIECEVAPLQENETQSPEKEGQDISDQIQASLVDQQVSTSSTQSSQPDQDSKLKKILDDFFTQVEMEGASRAQQKKRQFQSGKENAPTNLQGDVALETPKNHAKSQAHEEELNLSPLKKRHTSTKDSFSGQDTEISQDQDKISKALVSESFDSDASSTSGKTKDTETSQVQKQGQDETAETQVQVTMQTQQEAEAEELRKKAVQLQKEKDSLRAPFSEINNSHSQKKRQDEPKQSEPAKRKNRIVDVNKVIFVDSYILNYSTFFPGKLLGSTLNVGNLSNSEQIVELSVDSNSFQFNKKTLNEKFNNPELPFSMNEEGSDPASKKSLDSIVNSEIKHEAWYIENPISKELTKRITLKLGPKAEQDFIIVVRSPNAKRCENLLSIINIGLLTYADEQFGVKESFEDFLKVNYGNSMKEFLRDRKKVAQQQRLEILLAGKVEVPNLICQKELMVQGLNERIIPLVVKKGQAGQKFRIPFKNNGPQDLDLEFTFAKQSAVICGPDLKGSASEQRSQQMLSSPIEFVSMPSNIKIPQNGSAILNIAAKLKNSYQLASIGRESQSSNKDQKAEKYNHLLIAKVKDTQIMFSFIIEASVLESSGNANAMS